MEQILAFVMAGGLSGAMIAYAMDMTSTKELVQGTVGGVLAGLLMALMIPRG